MRDHVQPDRPLRVVPPVLRHHPVNPATGPDPDLLRVHPDRLDAPLRWLAGDHAGTRRR